jgi:hypothetical protein
LLIELDHKVKPIRKHSTHLIQFNSINRAAKMKAVIATFFLISVALAAPQRGGKFLLYHWIYNKYKINI